MLYTVGMTHVNGKFRFKFNFNFICIHYPLAKRVLVVKIIELTFAWLSAEDSVRLADSNVNLTLDPNLIEIRCVYICMFQGNPR